MGIVKFIMQIKPVPAEHYSTGEDAAYNVQTTSPAAALS